MKIIGLIAIGLAVFVSFLVGEMTGMRMMQYEAMILGKGRFIITGIEYSGTPFVRNVTKFVWKEEIDAMTIYQDGYGIGPTFATTVPEAHSASMAASLSEIDGGLE